MVRSASCCPESGPNTAVLNAGENRFVRLNCTISTHVRYSVGCRRRFVSGSGEIGRVLTESKRKISQGTRNKTAKPVHVRVHSTLPPCTTPTPTQYVCKEYCYPQSFRTKISDSFRIPCPAILPRRLQRARHGTKHHFFRDGNTNGCHSSPYSSRPRTFGCVSFRRNSQIAHNALSYRQHTVVRTVDFLFRNLHRPNTRPVCCRSFDRSDHSVHSTRTLGRRTLRLSSELGYETRLCRLRPRADRRSFCAAHLSKPRESRRISSPFSRNVRHVLFEDYISLRKKKMQTRLHTHVYKSF